MKIALGILLFFILLYITNVKIALLILLCFILLHIYVRLFLLPATPEWVKARRRATRDFYAMYFLHRRARYENIYRTPKDKPLTFVRPE